MTTPVPIFKHLLKTILVTCWDHFGPTDVGSILKQVWDHLRNTSGQFWNNFETTLRPLWDHFGEMLVPCGDHLGVFWGPLGHEEKSKKGPPKLPQVTTHALLCRMNGSLCARSRTCFPTAASCARVGHEGILNGPMSNLEIGP